MTKPNHNKEFITNIRQARPPVKEPNSSVYAYSLVYTVNGKDYYTTVYSRDSIGYGGFMELIEHKE